MDTTQQQYEPERSGSLSRPDAKVAIPRLQNINYQMSATTRAQRPRTDVVSKACTQCRKRKIKCSGDRPRCTNCQRQGHSCHYEQERKDRLRGAIRKAQVLAELLMDVSSQLDEAGKKKIEETLALFEDDTPPPLTPIIPSLLQTKRQRAESSYYDDDTQSFVSADVGEARVSASVGFNEDLDFVQEDFFRDNEAESTGYMGRNSQVQWLRALEAKVEQPEGEPPHMVYGPPGASAEAFNQRAEALRERQQRSHQSSSTGYYFYLDRNNIEIDIGDPNIVPSAATAERLFGYYKKAVHSPFKLVDGEFEQQLQVYFNTTDSRVKMTVCSKWKAVMNLVFAIGARYSHLVDAEWRADDRDHLVYMWRAVNLLQLQQMRTLTLHPEQRLIQAIGLLSFYYLTIGHVSKAWYMVGMAIRHAQAAGLHLRYENPSMQSDRTRSLAELWWALNSIECILTSILGRPRAIAAKDCTVPLPGAAGTETQSKSRESTTPSMSATSSEISRGSSSSTSGKSAGTNMHNFITAYIKLDLIMDRILSGLYSPRKSIKSWKNAQSEITVLSEELEIWALQSLPQGPAAATAATVDHSLDRESLLLYLYYYNAKICITRPCLCRLDRRIKGQSEESARFNQKTAEACIGAALDIAAILPNTPNPTWYYKNGPWWCAVHMIMQGLTVLLLELSLNCAHLTIDKSHITSCVEKLMRWLESMKSLDAVSESAYTVVTKVLNKQTPEEAAGKQLPYLQPAQGYERHGYNIQNPALDSQVPLQMPNQPSLQQMEHGWPGSDAFNSGPYFPQPVASGFYQSNLPSTEYLNDPNAGMYQFGQPQMNMFYGNPYPATMDQWDWDSMTVDDTGHAQAQQPNQGDRFGQ